MCDGNSAVNIKGSSPAFQNALCPTVVKNMSSRCFSDSKDKLRNPSPNHTDIIGYVSENCQLSDIFSLVQSNDQVLHLAERLEKAYRNNSEQLKYR